MADVVIRIGNAHTNLSDEYILEVQHAAHDLADQSGFFVELHIVQRVPKRRGMTPIQWFGMTVLSGAGLKMGSDLYDYGKTLCKNLWEAGGRHRHQGVRLLDEIPVESVSFRALSKMTARTRDRGLSSGRIAILINEWIEQRFALPAPDVPSLTGRDPELAAQEVRARWGLGERPIGNIIHLLEAHGIRVFSLTDDTKDLDAYCLNWHGQPFILLSREKSGERRRFNAAHELGHLVLHGEDEIPNGPGAEAEANQFAAALLMPRAGVLAQGLNNASVRQVLEAKKRWSVAAMAMAHRTNELGLMTEWAYRTVCVDLSRLGYRRGEPRGIPHESSMLLTKVMQRLRDSESGLTTIANDLGLSAVEVQAYLMGLTPLLVGGESGDRTAGHEGHLQLVE